jgi:hypothetical protein
VLASLVLVLSVLTVLVALARTGRERPHGPVLTTLARDVADGAAVLARLVDRGRG